MTRPPQTAEREHPGPSATVNERVSEPRLPPRPAADGPAPRQPDRFEQALIFAIREAVRLKVERRAATIPQMRKLS